MKPKFQTPERETRVLSGQVELRAASENEKPKVRGYAAVFDKESENLGGFREVIAPGAFDSVLQDDVRALLNHDPNLILARSKSGEGTLKISTDERGLYYEFDAPDTQAGRDLTESLRRGDIDQSSFSFTVEKDEWQQPNEEEGRSLMKRTITKVARLFDVSPVTYPAYPDATVALRSLQEFRAEEAPEPEPEPEPENNSLSHWQRRMGLIDKTAETTPKTK